MFGKTAAGVARLAGAVLGGCLAWTAAPAHAQDAALQASRDGRLYVLVDDGGRFVLAENGQPPLALAAETSLMFEALAALDSGWLLAGHRPAADGSRRELVLLRGGGGGPRESLPVPPSDSSSVRSPQPLIEAGELVGLAWLEGTGGALGVRAASWNGAGFAAAEWVSPPGTGSQLALSAAVLADGGWLLVWSAFDGEDDEILWSRREGPAWTPPARLHAGNAVPDITPVVTATTRGAVAAWSRYENGHYRVRVARLRGDTWRDEERLGGAGSVFPFFVADDSAAGAQLVFAEGAAGEWQLVELTASGQVESRSRYQAESRGRPVVRREAASGARLQWLGAGAARRERAP